VYVLDIPVTATVSELPAGRSPVLRNRAVVRVSNLHARSDCSVCKYTVHYLKDGRRKANGEDVLY